ncbi:MAG: N-acetylmuramoyl-L-alanine amidase [Parasphingorhabdus sp.]|jgi:N-acetylmuramoyl-L-alanine amidase
MRIFSINLCRIFCLPTGITIIFCCVLLGSGNSYADTGLHNLRMWHGPEKTRLVFDLTNPVEHKVFGLQNPDRLVVDLNGAKFTGNVPLDATVGPLLHRIRTGTPKPGVLRFVLDLKQPVASEVFVLPPTDIYGHRLVIDLKHPGDDKTAVAVVTNKEPAVKQQASPPASKPQLVIAIDAGHGGEDPGALGGKKTREKNVVLAIALQLKALLDAHPGLEGVLTRNGDYYISLRKRTQIARSHNADLFVSIHADGFYKRTAKGMSVYALSNRGATSETARWLANKENSSDLAGGVSLKNKDDMLAHVLLDLSMNRTVNDSIILAKQVLSELKQLGPVHSKRVEQAGFAVLKSPDMPSILVESGYITNPREEKLLRSERYQKKLAKAIFTGILRYLKFHENPSAANTHIVSAGDSLSMLAQRYGISLSSLKQVNRLSDSQIFVGQKLKIPSSGS